MKVTMETARKLQKIRNAGDYDVVAYEGGEYVQVIDRDTLSYDGNRHISYWEGLAVKIGEDIDSDGWTPLYIIIWEIDNPAETDGLEVDDWENPEEVKKDGEINIFTGRIA